VGIPCRDHQWSKIRNTVTTAAATSAETRTGSPSRAGCSGGWARSEDMADILVHAGVEVR
jgi:hypothetical protein